MKRLSLIALAFLASATFAVAGPGYAPATDVLGAHLNYGRGCSACHAPHSGVYGNGNAKTADASAGTVALWGEDLGSLYGQTLTFGSTDGSTGYTEVLPASLTAGTPDVAGVLMCLSCHDGNYATGAMMKNQVYETLPSTYGTFNTIPTLLGNDKTGTGNYLNDHPVGTNASMSCGGTYDWDCTLSGTGAVQMTGTYSAKFKTNYGFFVRPGVLNGTTPIVLCTTCHNQHVMNVVKVSASNSGMTAGYYQTMFFLRAPYNPTSTTSNEAAQFCRQCHGAESNEMNNGTAGTTF
jgi:hypothetical protein